MKQSIVSSSEDIEIGVDSLQNSSVRELIKGMLLDSVHPIKLIPCIKRYRFIRKIIKNISCSCQ